VLWVARAGAGIRAGFCAVPQVATQCSLEFCAVAIATPIMQMQTAATSARFIGPSAISTAALIAVAMSSYHEFESPEDFLLRSFAG
jgi:hypothetical protein